MPLSSAFSHQCIRSQIHNPTSIVPNAYTSDSFALNHSASLNVNDNAPIAAAEYIIMASQLLVISFFQILITETITRYKKEAVNAELIAASAFIRSAGFEPIGIIVASLPSSTHNGAPGGWGTDSVYAQAINSPQSQNERVFCMVYK